MQQKHDSRLMQKQIEVKQQLQKQAESGNEYEKAKHDILKNRDGFSDPEARKKYNELSAELSPITSQISRLFKQYFPKNDEPEEEWKRRGKNFDVRRLVKNYGSGMEKPLGKKENFREKHFLLQIIVDVSGSMKQEGRIENAVKACIAMAEAAKKTNVEVEVLASDDHNVKEDESYLIKSFEEDFSGPVKERMISMLTSFGGENEDGNSVEAAMERLNKQKSIAKAQYDQVGSLAVFISDSTTQETDTRDAVLEARKKTPFEGLAISSDPEIKKCVKFHFGEDSIIPDTIKDLPNAMMKILLRNVSRVGGK
jgi:hypothetical protein